MYMVGIYHFFSREFSNGSYKSSIKNTADVSYETDRSKIKE